MVSIALGRRNEKRAFPHSLSPTGKYTVQPRVTHETQPHKGTSRQGQLLLTFTRVLGHLKLDQKLFQLFPYCGSSDEALVIQEMLLTPLRALAVLRDSPDGGSEKSRQALDPS